MGPLLLLGGLLAVPLAAAAQHEHGTTSDSGRAIEQISLLRMASGTAWLPEATRQHAYHANLGRWSVMAHGALFVQYIRESGIRGEGQLGSVNWLMLAASRPFGGGALRVRTMFSAEPLTLTGRGYPQLLQVSQRYQGETVSDRQHPHELFTELAVAFDRAASANVGVSAYVGVVGEPALGPVAFVHRPSAAHDPTAPLGHHAQDVMHKSFGVATVAAFTRNLRIEASAFNGAHPDDLRTDLEPIHLDSYSARLTVNPSPRWSAAAWFASLAATSGEHAHGAMNRFGVAVLHTRPGPSGREWSSAVIYGATLPEGTRRPLNSVLVESSFELDATNVVFGRAEYVRRTAADLSLVGSVSRELDIGALSLGYARTLLNWRGLSVALGGRGIVNLIPSELEPFYGSRTPVGGMAYLRVRPAPATSGHSH